MIAKATDHLRIDGSTLTHGWLVHFRIMATTIYVQAAGRVVLRDHYLVIYTLATSSSVTAGPVQTF